MIFSVKDLKHLSRLAALFRAKDDESYDEFLRESQPFFYEIIEEFGHDPRCYNAYRFCTLFCSTALIHAMNEIERTLPIFSYKQVHDWLAILTQKKGLHVGRRAITYPDRIQKHVLFRLNFEEEDTKWLCITISTFLVLIENAS